MVTRVLSGTICPLVERAGVLMVQRDAEGGVRFVLYRGPNPLARC